MKDAVQYSTYDWFKDIWLPAAGAILIPVAIAFFTWWFGASRSEKQKELRELRDNLNLLLNLVGINIVDLLSTHRYTTKMSLQINNDTLDAIKLEKDGFFDALFFNDLLKEIDITKYSQCLSKDDNYLQNLIKIKNLNYQIDRAIKHRNNIVNDISNCESNEIKYARIVSFVESSRKDLYDLNTKIDFGLKLGKEFIDETKALESKIDNLKLIKIDFDNEDFYKKATSECDNKILYKAIERD
ncbi:MAG: hypothetical protein J6V53_05065 [Alphaproteobacteria bacterium]|nr:hypothetical protein [Alphaproteobacteria bacterium]